MTNQQTTDTIQVPYVEVEFSDRARFEDWVKQLRAEGVTVTFRLEREMFMDTYVDFCVDGPADLIAGFKAWADTMLVGA